MTAYVALAIFPILLGLCFPKLHQSKKQRITFFVLCGIVMLFFMGLRHYSLGSTDTMNYYNAMQRAISSSSWHNFYDPDYYEVGLQAFMYLLSRFVDHPQWLLFVTSLFYILCVFYFVNHNSDNIPLSITTYISLGLMQFHLQGMRQSIAMCICLLAYEQAKRKHFIKFLLLVLFATAFHQTAVVFLPIYFLCRLKFSWKSMVGIFGGSILMVIFTDNIINLANEAFDKNYVTTVTSGGFVALGIYLVILALTLWYYSIHKTDDKTPLLFVLVLATLCYGMRYTGALVAERVSFYFSFSQVAMLPAALRLFAPKDRKIMGYVISVFVVALFIYRLIGSEFVVYKFFWQQII